ncbi:MAG: hypothetical protein ACLFQV_03235 [Vulcanimicrobiota bacterium]
MASRLVKSVKENNFSLVVSIPKNDLELAQAAEKAGADGIKVHLNVGHFASGTDFGSWQKEKKAVYDILAGVSIPVGILPGADVVAEKNEIVDALQMGIDFIDSFAHNFPVYLWGLEEPGKMVAVNQGYNRQQVEALDKLGTDIFEATLLTHEDYGKDLTLKDLALYGELCSWTEKPVLIPTQKKIKPGEVRYLKQAGASGIIIGAVATGHTPLGLFETAHYFKQAINRL